MNSNLVLTISIGEKHEKISELTLKTIENYAKKVNADFINLKTAKSNGTDWEKTQVYDLFNKYKRIILFDIDLIIREDCPNLFEIVPEKELGAFNEGKYVFKSDDIKITARMYDENLGDITSKYYNTGVLILSRKHKQLFKIPKYFKSSFTSYFNMMLQKDKVEMFDLDLKMNRVHFMDKYCGISRLDSYIIHYYEAPDNLVFKLIKDDLDDWKKDSPDYKYDRNICIQVSAGMGDQLCSEPAIRYTQKIYPDAKFHVVTHFPRIFDHLDANVYSYDEWKGLKDPVYMMYTCPDDDKSDHHLSHVLFHPCDFSSMSMIKRNIPHIDKTINLRLDPKDVRSVINMVDNKKKEKPMVIVHAGKWWPSKTLPLEWWQEVVDKLSEKLTVGLIGKNLSEEQGYQEIDCPSDGYDFRDITTLGELIALISMTKVLVTNDSSPLHIAGAFDNWIVTIPTCKHPDHILPYRNGVQTYKTKTLYKRLLLDDLEIRHTEYHPDTIDKIPTGKTLYEYIPDVDDVVREVFEIYNV